MSGSTLTLRAQVEENLDLKRKLYTLQRKVKSMARSQVTPTQRIRYKSRGSSVRRSTSRYSRSNLYTRGRRMAYAKYKKRSEYALPKFLMAQLYPFDREVQGVRVPDDSTAPSSPFMISDTVTCALPATSTTGNAHAMFFYPNPGTIATQAAATAAAAASSWTWPASYGGKITCSKYGAITAQYEVARPVAHGIRISCSLAPTTVTGFCHVGLYSLSDYNQSTWSLPTTIAQLTDLPFYKRMTLASLTQTPFVVVNKYLDQTAFRYIDPDAPEQGNITTAGNFHVASSWMGIIVVVEGHGQAASSQILSIETVCHLEGQSKFGALAQDGPAEPPRPDMFAATSEAVSHGEAGFCDDTNSVRARVAEGVRSFGRAMNTVNAFTQTAQDILIGGAAVYGAVRGGMTGINNQRLK
nr:coat protein [Cressdnaviricota sp.]